MAVPAVQPVGVVGSIGRHGAVPSRGLDLRLLADRQQERVLRGDMYRPTTSRTLASSEVTVATAPV